MTPILFDPADPPPGAWPGDCAERAYIEAIAAAGPHAMIPNVVTQWRAIRVGDHVLPVTINHGETGGSYVTQPHSAYALYARQELEIADTGALKPVLRLAIAIADRLMRWGAVNRIVHVDNWLLSTNLHGHWQGEGLAAIGDLLRARFPDHALAIRSIDAWSCPALLDAARAAGWMLLASRQIWVTGDMTRDWAGRRDTMRDRALLARSGLVEEHFATMSDADAARIADLYHQLYVGKYSPLNPVFSPEYVRMTWANGFVAYRGLRDGAGRIMAVAGSLVRGDVLTPPVVGYDTSRPQAEGLYRFATLLFSDMAAARGLRLNGSAGAAGFKRNRGASGVIEYMAIDARHLAPHRRAVFALMRWLLDHLAVPMMRRRGL